MVLKTKSTQHQHHWKVWAAVCVTVLSPMEVGEGESLCQPLAVQERLRSYNNMAGTVKEE